MPIISCSARTTPGSGICCAAGSRIISRPRSRRRARLPRRRGIDRRKRHGQPGEAGRAAVGGYRAVSEGTDPTGAAEGYSCARDYQLFGPGPKRLLALDGGGVRGAITVAFLERIEALLREHHGRQVRLGDYFNLVGGTSTGSIITGALALGYTAAQVKDIYTRLAPLAFVRRKRSIPVFQPKFDVRGLRGEIEKIIGDMELQSDRLITGLCVVTKRMDTGSPWILANNPRAPYWNDGPENDGNRYYKLANLVRASTAAPHYFDPELLPVSHRKALLPASAARPMDKPFLARFVQAILERIGWRSKQVPDLLNYGLFIDGGMTPHHNPTFAPLQMISLKPFGLCWRT